MEKPSVAHLVERYLFCREQIKICTKTYEENILKYQNGIKLAEILLLEELNRVEGQNIKTEHGTVYRKVITSFTVADREAWLDFVFENNQRDMLTAHVAKEAVKEYLETNGGTPPPGLNMTRIYNVNVRSPDNEPAI